MLGIIAMRFAAQGFIKLLEKFPALEVCAFLAVGVIGLKLTCEIPSNVLFSNPPVAIEQPYKTADEYIKLGEAARKPIFHIPHVMSISTLTPEAPKADKLSVDEYSKANAL